MDHIALIALNTWRELIRGKILYGVFFFAIAIVLIASLFGSVTIGDQVLMIKDFGLFSISLFSVGFCVIAGSSLLQKELNRKTVYNILSKPVERRDFVLGKYLGILSTALVMMLLMAMLLELYLWMYTGKLDLILPLALVGQAFELVVVCALSIFFSSLVVTPVLSGLFTFSLFLAGRSVDYLLYFIEQGAVHGALAEALKAGYYLLPQLSKLNIANEVVFEQYDLIPMERFIAAAGYSVGYAGILLILSVLIFSRREFN